MKLAWVKISPALYGEYGTDVAQLALINISKAVAVQATNQLARKVVCDIIEDI